MAEEAASSLLGGSNKRFCFAREDFLRENFDVDEFISSCRRRVSLESLHEDLSVHYKALKNAMMELINKDYADFVSLSSSLVGLEKEIGDILVPLGQLQEEVSTVKMTVETARGKLERLLEQRADFVKKKAALERYLVISQKIDSIEQLLRLDSQNLTSAAVSGGDSDDEDVLERVTSAFNELQFQVEQAENSAFVSAITPRISAITSSLQSGLQKSFQAGLVSNDSLRLHRCLRTYSAIDRTSAVEAIFRTSVVRPHLSPVISSRSSLDDIYPAVIDFINTQCTTLVTLTSSFHSSASVSAVSTAPAERKSSLANIQGIDFLANAVWPEVVSLLCSQTPTIFAAGNPDVFRENYTKTIDFLGSFERLCRTQASVKRLRSHASYRQLMSKWSLPVYFQLRFQEIAWALEEVLANAFGPRTDQTGFRCAATCTLWSSLEKCWSDAVFLQALSHRFWKLTLQILSRYCTWASELQLQQSTAESGKDSSASSGSAASSRACSVSPPGSSSGLTASCSQLVDVVLDTEQLLNKLPPFLSNEIQPRLLACNSSPQQISACVDGLLESRLALKQLQPRLGQLISDFLCQECLVHVEAARTVPRLFRHTNRAAPTEASAYVSTLVRRVRTFAENNKHCARAFVESWCYASLSQLCVRYKAVVSDILVSVKKTEDSMQRLKRTRRSMATTSTTTTPTPTNGAGDDSAATADLSDEDKIRRQLFLDVESFADRIEELGYQLRSTAAYTELQSLVQPASPSASAASK